MVDERLWPPAHGLRHQTSPGYTAPGPFRERMLRSLSSCFGLLANNGHAIDFWSFLICSCGMLRITKDQEYQRRQWPCKGCYPKPNPKRPGALLGHLSGKRYRSNRDNENKPPHSVVSRRPPDYNIKRMADPSPP